MKGENFTVKLFNDRNIKLLEKNRELRQELRAASDYFNDEVRKKDVRIKNLEKSSKDKKERINTLETMQAGFLHLISAMTDRLNSFTENEEQRRIGQAAMERFPEEEPLQNQEQVHQTYTAFLNDKRDIRLLFAQENEL